VLEAGLGTVDLGVRAQIAEIERGFFDLLEVRRETRAGDAAGGKQG
jgi:flagellar assembly protein FliH